MTAVTMKAPDINTTTQPAKKFLGGFRFQRSWNSTLCQFAPRRHPQLKHVKCSPVGSRWAKCRPLIFSLILLLIGMSAAYTQTDVWQGPPGANSWFSPNWSNDGIPPTATQAAVVDNGNDSANPGCRSGCRGNSHDWSYDAR